MFQWMVGGKVGADVSVQARAARKVSLEMDSLSTFAARETMLPCPVCGALAAFAYTHPDCRIYRCDGCTHAFTDPASVTNAQHYSPEYFDELHKNWFAHPNVRLFQWIANQIPQNARSVIDVGCGRGHFLDFLRKVRPNLSLVGVDLSNNSDRDGIKFFCGDVLDLELGQFDFVVTMGTIEHVADLARFTDSLCSLCGPHGTVCVMTLDENSLLYRLARIARKLGVPVAFNQLYDVHHLNHFTRRSLAELLSRSKLQVRRRLAHNAPIRAIDVPVRNPLLRQVLIAAVGLTFFTGTLLRCSYLQSVLARRSDG